jgi:hypothetical protein
MKTITDSQVQDMLPFIFAPHVIKRKYCLPQGISSEDSTVPVIDWIKARKDYYSGYPAYKAVQDAEAQLWPCRQ